MRMGGQSSRRQCTVSVLTTIELAGAQVDQKYLTKFLEEVCTPDLRLIVQHPNHYAIENVL